MHKQFTNLIQLIKLTIKLSPFFISSLSYAISYDSIPSDSLLLVKKSRVEWCLQQNVVLNIQRVRLIEKDSIIQLSNDRISEKDLQIESVLRDNKEYKDQISILLVKDTLKSNYLIKVETANKQIKKQNTVLKTGIIIWIVLKIGSLLL